MKDSTARAISTAAIWIAVAIVLAGGVFQRNWTGDAALMTLMAVVLLVSGTAAGATFAVWRGSSAASSNGGEGRFSTSEPGSRLAGEAPAR